MIFLKNGNHIKNLGYNIIPTGNIKCGTDEDNYNLIKNHYPWFLDTYTNYKFPIQRADAVRPFILYEYGGMYADMDYECFINFEKVIPMNTNNVYIGESNVPKEYVQNSLMLSPKGHPFWKIVFDKMIERKDKLYLGSNEILYKTGPRLIKDCLDNSVIILPEYKFNAKKECNNCYSIHHNAFSWKSQSRGDIHLKIIFLIILIFIYINVGLL